MVSYPLRLPTLPRSLRTSVVEAPIAAELSLRSSSNFLVSIATMSALRLLPRLARPMRRSFASASILRSDKPTRPLDPFPLPFDPALAEAEAERNASRDPVDVVDGWELPPPLDRTGEKPDTMRARLIYQTRKRGILETDLLLSTFARDFLPSMSVEEMQQFDKLLDEPDWDIYYWSIEKRPAPERWADTELLKKCVKKWWSRRTGAKSREGNEGERADGRLQKHARNEGKVVRLMPNLEDIERK